jgi:hypothetical protein
MSDGLFEQGVGKFVFRKRAGYLENSERLLLPEESLC